MEVEFSDTVTGFNGTGTIEDRMALALIGKAIKGDVAAAKEILDSVYGKGRNEEKEEMGFEVIRPKPPGHESDNGGPFGGP